MKRIALFPGSFDPFTIGHESIVRRSLDLFDEIVIGVGVNSTKSGLFTPEQRVNWIKEVFKGEPKVSVESYSGLTIEYCKQINARYILRGLRNSTDFGFERGIGQVNKAMNPLIETVFILALPEHSAISSTIIRDIIRNGGDARQFVPKAVSLK
jgi:pantetheine-phosphate adenylyltransferase